MDIIITMLGETHTVRVNPQDTVGDLKNVICMKLHVPPERQRLVFINGKKTELSDDCRPISYYGLQSGSRVSLLVTEPSPPATVQVFLRNEKGKVSTYDVKLEETVDELKRRVQSREGVPVNQQRLVFQGREMVSGRLSNYNVEALSTIEMLLRLRGG